MTTLALAPTVPPLSDTPFAEACRALLPVIGRSRAAVDLLSMVETLAGTDTPVLVSGESGAGKELVARLLHETGKKPGPYLAHNCAAIAEGTLESDLFGHAAGAFTGAVGARRGLFEEANGGTAFLDEIGEISERLPAQLLRVLQEGEIRRVGESRPRNVRVRILAATNRNLAADVRAGRFREDLYYRLNVVEVRVPPLRERRTDIPLFVRRFLEESVREGETLAQAVTPEAMECLLGYAWPGNVRQLRNEILRAAILTRGRGPIRPADLSPDVGGREDTHAPAATSGSLREQVDQAQRMILLRTLQAHAWNKTRSAGMLGITRQGLIKMMHRLDIPLAAPMDADSGGRT